MSRILTVDPETATGAQKEIFAQVREQYGVVPGVFQILLVDLKLGGLLGELYQHLNLRASSPLTKLQREMLATVVNGRIGGAS